MIRTRILSWMELHMKYLITYDKSTYMSTMKVIDTYIMRKLREPEITMVESVHRDNEDK
jgi:hypothetical protein